MIPNIYKPLIFFILWENRNGSVPVLSTLPFPLLSTSLAALAPGSKSDPFKKVNHARYCVIHTGLTDEEQSAGLCSLQIDTHLIIELLKTQ